MKNQFKAKFNLKSAFKIVNILLVLINLVLLYFVYGFVNDNIIKTVSPGPDGLGGTNSHYDDINIQQFEEIVESLKKR